MRKLIPILIVLILSAVGGTSYYAYSVYKGKSKEDIENREMSLINEDKYTPEEIDKLNLIESQLVEELNNKNYTDLIQHYKNSFVATANYIEPNESILKVYNDGVYAYYNELSEFNEDIFRLIHEESLTQETIKFMISKFEDDIKDYINKKQLNEMLAKERKDKIREQREVEKKSKEGVRIGMTQEEVLMSSWGKPTKINKTTNAYGTSEQWVYPNYNYLYFDDGILTSISH